MKFFMRLLLIYYCVPYYVGYENKWQEFSIIFKMLLHDNIAYKKVFSKILHRLFKEKESKI